MLTNLGLEVIFDSACFLALAFDFEHHRISRISPPQRREKLLPQILYTYIHIYIYIEYVSGCTIASATFSQPQRRKQLLPQILHTHTHTHTHT
jgi:hypothetical protein